MSDQAEIAAASAAKPRFSTVTLSTPIVRGETTINKITLRKPKGGELRGLTMQDIMTTDVSAMLRLIPRISDPPLIQDEADNLEADDLAEICGTIRGFFMTAMEVRTMEMLVAEHQPKT